LQARKLKDWQIFLSLFLGLYAIAKVYGWVSQPAFDRQWRDYGSTYDNCDGELDRRNHPGCPQ
jgi:hypothetical protein